MWLLALGMAELGGHKGKSKDMPIRLEDYPSSSSAFQDADSPQHKVAREGYRECRYGSR